MSAAPPDTSELLSDQAIGYLEPWRTVSSLIDSFIALDVHDVRFPTSDELDGSDAMNPSPDYSAAYAVLRTDSADGLEGHALAFTTGPATTYRSGPSKG